MEWTPEQEKAIHFRGGSAVVSAAAGSGKTAVLVERVICLLKDEEDPVSADRVVAATFTEKAAGELRARLDAALASAIEAEPENEYLKSQLIRLEDACISTISSFCLGLLRQHSALLDISPDFSVMDEAEGELEFSKALDAVLERFYETAEPAEKELLYSWYGGENDSLLCRILKELYDFSRNLPDWKKSFREWLEWYENPEKLPPSIKKKYMDSEIVPALSRMREICAEISGGENEKAKRFAQEWTEAVSRFTLAADGGEEALSALSRASLPVLPRKTKDFDNSFLKERHSELKALWEQALPAAGLLFRAERDCRECAPVLRLLCTLTERLEEEFGRRKRLKSKVDFADIELMTLRLLEDEKTAEEIGGCISVIIVDEFQDSNEVQYEIFRRLSRNGENLFFVGDVKQSIYRFRGADPRVFVRLLEDESFTKILLNRNFRSAKPVIDSVNALFEGTMTRELGGIDYDEEAKLIQGARYETDERYRTELIRIYGDSAEEARAAEAAYIADRIVQMVEDGFPVTEKGVRRPCRWGDFSVLMGRYSASAHIYKNAFAKAGVPFEAKDESGYTDFSEVKFALALLRVIDNPYRSRDLAAVLTLPPWSFTADELAAAKLGGGKKRFGSLYTGLREYARTSEKACRFCEELEALRGFAAEQPVERLVRKIYDESGFAEAMRALPDGEKRDANLKLLISYARRFSENGSRSLYDFLNYMSRAENGQARLAQAQSAAGSENSVKIMTIHGSKGLEFPICFVANLSSAFRNRANPYLDTETQRGIGMKIVDRESMLVIDTFMHRLVSGSNRSQELSEEMRLLYVAATRAKEKLIFTAPLSERRSEPQAHLKWILESGAVRQGLIEQKEICGYRPQIRPEKEEESSEPPCLLPFRPYEYLRYSEIPAKVTATQVGVKSVDDFSEYVHKIDRFLRMPSFVREDAPAKLTGKKKGDAYHKAMELLDFSADASQLGRLYENGKLTEAEYACIRGEEIAAFLNSPLCGRIRKSGEVHREFPIFCEYLPDGLAADFPENEEKPFIQGIADLYFVEDGEIVLVDYKTNAAASPELLREEYEGQLRVYRDALERMTGLKVRECLIYSFPLGETVSV